MKIISSLPTEKIVTSEVVTPPISPVRQTALRIAKIILIGTAIFGASVGIAAAVNTFKGVRHSDWLYFNGGTGNCINPSITPEQRAQCEAVIHRVLSFRENAGHVLAYCLSRSYKALMVLAEIIAPKK